MQKGGGYILPVLRIMSSDLVIDEIDDFTGDDLIAVGRLVHLAGMLGRKVMISSATIPPDLAEGYFRAYREGFAIFSKTRDVRFRIGCAWVDEFKTVVETVLELDTKGAMNQYGEKHQAFVDARIGELKKEPVKRKAEIISLDNIKTERESMGEQTSYEEDKTIETLYFDAILQSIVEKHRKHAFGERETGKNISFGIVRVANISPCVCLTKYLLEGEWPEDIDVRVMAYHSRQVLLLRNEQERHLDAVLKRSKDERKNTTVFENEIIRRHIKRCDRKNLIFIVVATPVEEVGRDHDFDWSTLEPSSFRSIIQLAGRLLRHRDYVPEYPNMAILQYNLRALKNNSSVPAFCRPGYEKSHIKDKNLKLATHDLKKLVDEVSLKKEGVNAIPRIKKPKELDPTKKLADLEHYAILNLLNNYEKKGPETIHGWVDDFWWLTGLPQILSAFRKSEPQVKLYLISEDSHCIFMEKNGKGDLCEVEKAYNIHHTKLGEQILNRLWLKLDYQMFIERIADQFDISEYSAALKYGEIMIPDREDFKEFLYSDYLGMWKE